MPVRLRLALHGRRHNKIFHIVAMNQRSARNSRPIETLGIYDPRLPLGQTYKTIEWSVDRLKWWLEKGALPSKPVVQLLTLGGVIPAVSKYHAKTTLPKTPPPSAEPTVATPPSMSPMSAAIF